MKKLLKKILINLVILSVVTCAAGYMIGLKFYKTALLPKPEAVDASALQ